MSKLTGNARKRAIYARVLNASNDTSLAQKARGWSDETLMERLGIETPKSEIKIRPRPEKGSKAERRKENNWSYRLRKFNYAKTQQYAARDAKDLLRKPYEKIDDYVPLYQPVKQKPSRPEIMRREKQWSRWSMKVKPDHPEWITSQAEYLNMSQGFDPDSSWGYAVMFYHYRDGSNIDILVEQMTPDKWSDGDIYESPDFKKMNAKKGGNKA